MTSSFQFTKFPSLLDWFRIKPTTHPNIFIIHFSFPGEALDNTSI